MCLAACALAAVGIGGLRSSDAATVMVSSYRNGSIIQVDTADGIPRPFASAPAGITALGELAIGPDGSIYASASTADSVYRFDGKTGQNLGTVVTAANGLDGPRGLTFGPDGCLYISSANNARVFRYSPETGTSSRFNAVGSLTSPIGLAFGPSGDLYVADVSRQAVVRLAGGTGTSLGIFASASLTKPQGLVFGPDGDLYVANQDTYQILRYSGSDGALKGTFVDDDYPYNPTGMAFADGYFYTTNLTGGATNDGLLMFDRYTGAYIEPVFNGGGNFWSAGLVVVPEPTFLGAAAAGTAWLLRRPKRNRSSQEPAPADGAESSCSFG